MDNDFLNPSFKPQRPQGIRKVEAKARPPEKRAAGPVDDPKLSFYQNKIAKYKEKCSRHLDFAESTKEDSQQLDGEIAFTKDFQLESALTNAPWRQRTQVAYDSQAHCSTWTPWNSNKGSKGNKGKGKKDNNVDRDISSEKRKGFAGFVDDTWCEEQPYKHYQDTKGSHYKQQDMFKDDDDDGEVRENQRYRYKKNVDNDGYIHAGEPSLQDDILALERASREEDLAPVMNWLGQLEQTESVETDNSAAEEQPPQAWFDFYQSGKPFYGKPGLEPKPTDSECMAWHKLHARIHDLEEKLYMPWDHCYPHH